MIPNCCTPHQIQVSSFVYIGDFMLLICELNTFAASLGLGDFGLDDEEFMSGDFNSENDDVKELEADNYEDQLPQQEVITHHSYVICRCVQLMNE